MVAVHSTMLPLGTPIPDFALPDTRKGHEDQVVTPDSLAGRSATLVMFICNHCPFVKHVRDELARLGRDYQGRGVGIVAISSNDVEKHPDDSPQKMAEEAEAAGYTFPYCFDESQDVAKAFRASCTPDFYIFDHERRLFYRGQLDESRPPGRSGAALPVTGADLRSALDVVLARHAAPAEQKPSIGCNIKWKPGNEPEFFNPAGVA
jgi:peroxiredoxin